MPDAGSEDNTDITTFSNLCKIDSNCESPLLVTNRICAGTVLLLDADRFIGKQISPKKLFLEMSLEGMASSVLVPMYYIESISVSDIISSLGQDASFGSLKKLLQTGDSDIGDVCHPT